MRDLIIGYGLFDSLRARRERGALASPMRATPNTSTTIPDAKARIRLFFTLYCLPLVDNLS